MFKILSTVQKAVAVGVLENDFLVLPCPVWEQHNLTAGEGSARQCLRGLSLGGVSGVVLGSKGSAVATGKLIDECFEVSKFPPEETWGCLFGLFCCGSP